MTLNSLWRPGQVNLNLGLLGKAEDHTAKIKARKTTTDMRVQLPHTTGLVILVTLTVLTAMPVSHTGVILLRTIEPIGVFSGANIALGMAGFGLMWAGLKQNEVAASLLGFIAGHLMFIGFFEFGFALAAQALAVQPIIDPSSGHVILSPSLQINEATFFILVPLLLIAYGNRQVHCNMILWLRAKFGASHGAQAATSQTHDHARITANETLFVIWTIYAISIATLDPRILGARHWLSTIIYLLFLVWPILLLPKAVAIAGAGRRIRYCIPIGILFWSWVEMLASMGLITEYYLYPFDYPILCVLTTLLAATLLWLTWYYSQKHRRQSHVAITGK